MPYFFLHFSWFSEHASVPTITNTNVRFLELNNVLLSSSQIAEASKERAQNLNPMVKVMTATSDLAEQPSSFFAQFDVVVVSRCSSKELLIKLNEYCRANGSLFYAAGVHGMFGYMFVDLDQHNFVE